MAKPNQIANLSEEFKVGRLESKIEDYEIEVAQLQQEIEQLRSEAGANNFDGTIDPSLLVPSRWQPRTAFDPVEMQEIEDSILAAGEVITPVLLLRDTNELIAGEQRTRIAVKLGMKVKYRRLDISDEVAADYATLENVKRSGLNPIDETNAVLDAIVRKLRLDSRTAAATLIRKIKNEMSGQVSKNNVVLKETVEQVESIVKQFTKGSLSLPSFASHRLKLLNIPSEIEEAISKGQIDYTKGVAIAKIKDDTARNELLQQSVAEDLSIRAIRKKANRVKGAEATASVEDEINIDNNDRLTADPDVVNQDRSNDTDNPDEQLEEKSEAILHAIRNKSFKSGVKLELNELLDRVIALLD